MSWTEDWSWRSAVTPFMPSGCASARCTGLGHVPHRLLPQTWLRDKRRSNCFVWKHSLVVSLFSEGWWWDLLPGCISSSFLPPVPGSAKKDLSQKIYSGKSRGRREPWFCKMKVTWATKKGIPLQCHVLGRYFEVSFGSFTGKRGKQPCHYLPNAASLPLTLEGDPVHHNQQNVHSSPLGSIWVVKSIR